MLSDIWGSTLAMRSCEPMQNDAIRCVSKPVDRVLWVVVLLLLSVIRRATTHLIDSAGAMG